MKKKTTKKSNVVAMQKKAKKTTGKSELPTLPEGKKHVLRLCYGQARFAAVMHQAFRGDEWHATIFNPHDDKADIHQPITALAALPKQSFDAVWLGNFLERLPIIQVQGVIAALRMLLKPDGQILIQVPNMELIADRVTHKGLNSEMLRTKEGPVYARELIHGYDRFVRHDAHAAHQSSYTPSMLASLLDGAGFGHVRVDGSALMMLGGARNMAKNADKTKLPKPHVKRPDYAGMMRQRDHISKQPAEKVHYPTKTPASN